MKSDFKKKGELNYEKNCKRLLSVLILATMILSFCISVSADDFSVTVEKIGEIQNKSDVFTGGENKSFSYLYLGAGFGVLQEGRKVKIVDVNGENHIDKIYDGVQMLYHGRYQLGAEADENNDEQYDLILEGTTVCRSNIKEKKALHDDLFVFETDSDYVIFDLEDAKELATVPVSEGTDAGIFDDDYWILRDGKRTFYDDDNKEVYTTQKKILMDWDGKINTYNHKYFVEKTDDNKYHVYDTDYKEMLTLDKAPDRILHDGQFYIEH